MIKKLSNQIAAELLTNPNITDEPMNCYDLSAIVEQDIKSILMIYFKNFLGFLITVLFGALFGYSIMLFITS